MAFPQPATSTDNRLQDTSNRLLSLEERMSRWSVLARAVEDAIEDNSRRIATLNRRIATLQDGVNQQQKFAQEEIAKKTPEEEAAKKTAEEAASKKFVEEEFAKKTAEEEAAKKVAEGEASKKAAEEERAQKTAEAEVAKKTAEEEVGKKVVDYASKEALANKVAEEEDAKKIVEEEAAKKTADDTSKDPNATKRIFVNNLPRDCDNQMLTNHFSKFGQIAKAFVKTDSEHHCGYVIFDHYSAVEAVADITEAHIIAGQEVIVTKCIPCADAADVRDGNEAADDDKCLQVAKTLASKGFTVDWILKFWRKYGVRPPAGVTNRNLQPAPGEWRGTILPHSATNEVVREIVIPETADKKCCYMDLDSAAVTPKKLVSHWWGATFYGDLLCILADATGLRGYPLNWFVNYGHLDGEPFSKEVMLKSYWMCIFAVNQHVSICGMCNDCNVVSTQVGTDASCIVCHRKLYNPCSCGSAKYQTGHVLCQMDKFDIVMAEMDDGLAVALDTQAVTLERVWVVSEIGKSLSTNKDIAWHMPDDIDVKYCGPCDVPMSSVRDCKASLEDDKLRILAQIESTVTIDRFDEAVQSQTLPIIRDFALLKLLKSEGGESGANAIEAILKRRANPNVNTGMGRNALFEAASTGQQAIAECLIQYRANLDEQDRVGATPVFAASQNGHDSIVEALVAAKANIDHPMNDGVTPLFMAVAKTQTRVMELLLSAKADIECTWRGQTLLYNAAQNGSDVVVPILLAARADANRAHADKGFTPTIIASQNGHDVVVKSLIAANAAIDQANNEGWTPLNKAAMNGHTAVVYALVEAKALVDMVNANGYTPLNTAAEKGYDTIVSSLIQSRANTDVPNNSGNTPTIAASENGHDAVVKSLIAANAAIGQANIEGWTPVNVAASHGFDPIVLSLIEARANVDLAPDEGETPVFMASNSGHDTVVKALAVAKADIDRPESNGATPIFASAQLGHADVVSILLAAKADHGKAMTIESCHSPLTIAAYMGHVQVCRHLLSAGANSSYSAKPTSDEPFATQGGTAIDIAREQQHSAIVALLQSQY